ncbi:MAG: hypothetical protein KAH35_01875 [Candidatus Atribacteria bacterium]|nr:hypothetical protein [Candidatus Atribacteria bacterium]
MLSWKVFKPSEDEWKNFLKIIKREIKYSEQLEEILYKSRFKKSQALYNSAKTVIFNIGGKRGLEI